MSKYFFTFLFCITLVGCGYVQTGDQSTPLDSEQFGKVMRSGGTFVDPEHGKELKLWYGAMEGVDDHPANGVAFLHHFEDGAFVVNVNLNIATVSSPEHYTVRLVSMDGSKSRDIGELTSITGDVRHALQATLTEDVSTLLGVEVYRSQATGASQSLVAKGTLKIPAAPTR